jgi:hypothetical protein
MQASGLRVPSPAASSPPNGSLKQEGSLQNGTPNGEGQAGAGQSAGKPGRKKRKAAPAAAPAADVLATSFPACPEGMPLQMTAVCTSERYSLCLLLSAPAHKMASLVPAPLRIRGESH